MPARPSPRPSRLGRCAAALGGLSILTLVAACNERAPEPPAPVTDAAPAAATPPVSPVPAPDSTGTATPPPGEAAPVPSPPTLPPDPNEPTPPDPMDPTAPRPVPPDGA